MAFPLSQSPIPARRHDATAHPLISAYKLRCSLQCLEWITTGHNLSLLKHDDWNVFRVCVQHSQAEQTVNHKSWNKYVSHIGLQILGHTVLYVVVSNSISRKLHQMRKVHGTITVLICKNHSQRHHCWQALMIYARGFGDAATAVCNTDQSRDSALGYNTCNTCCNSCTQQLVYRAACLFTS